MKDWLLKQRNYKILSAGLLVLFILTLPITLYLFVFSLAMANAAPNAPVFSNLMIGLLYPVITIGIFSHYPSLLATY